MRAEARIKLFETTSQRGEADDSAPRATPAASPATSVPNDSLDPTASSGEQEPPQFEARAEPTAVPMVADENVPELQLNGSTGVDESLPSSPVKSVGTVSCDLTCSQSADSIMVAATASTELARSRYRVLRRRPLLATAGFASLARFSQPRRVAPAQWQVQSWLRGTGPKTAECRRTTQVLRAAGPRAAGRGGSRVERGRRGGAHRSRHKPAASSASPTVGFPTPVTHGRGSTRERCRGRRRPANRSRLQHGAPDRGSALGRRRRRLQRTCRVYRLSSFLPFRTALCCCSTRRIQARPSHPRIAACRACIPLNLALAAYFLQLLCT